MAQRQNQRSFFDDESPCRIHWDEEDSRQTWIAKVVFPTGLDGVFDYRIPDYLLERVEPGRRLFVPLGRSNRQEIVYCVAVQLMRNTDRSSVVQGMSDAQHVLPVEDTNRSSALLPLEKEEKSGFHEEGKRPDSGEKAALTSKKFLLKDVLEVVDSERLLSDKMLDLTHWISDRYLCPWGQVLEAVLPAGVRDHAGTRLTTVYSAAENVETILQQLERLHTTKNVNLLTPKQQFVLKIAQKAEEPMTLSELSRAAKCSMVPINALKKLGLLRKSMVRRQSCLLEELEKPISRQLPLELNSDQRRALDPIMEVLQQQIHRTFLLHGVTGSGKTEIYLQAIAEVVDGHQQAIVLVPEISLTPQTVNRFKARFDSIAVLHSHLTDAERHREWGRIASGNVQVVIGARSAIFAPVPHLGLIVIDEEHENSFKQDTSPRYHAREVAEFRAQQEKIPLILGSATPSLESWFRQTTGRYQLLSLPNRVQNLGMPKVHIVDLRSRTVSGFTRGAIHQYLHQAINESLREDGQIILFLNRRGFSTQIQCPACGEVVKCPECDVALTHHQTQQIALCHYCDYQIPAPSHCPKCGFAGIRYSGFGTQKLQSELTSRFPNVPILRMDADTMQGHGTHERALKAFREGQYRILVGTQMIAKGLHFPNVTLVGVINADTALHLPDFRASERTFHLITQVAGRTGRGEKGGKVIVQTFNPDHPAIIAASHHDYAQFVRYEIEQRRGFGYPPFSNMIRLVVRGPIEIKTYEFAKLLAQKIRESVDQINSPRATDSIALDQEAKTPLFSAAERKTPLSTAEHSDTDNRTLRMRILGPTPAPFTKLRGNYRFHIHLHAANAELMRRAVKNVLEAKLKTSSDIQWIVDVDPLDML